MLIAALHAELDVDRAVTEGYGQADYDHAYDRLDAAVAKLDTLRKPGDPTGAELAAEIGRAEDGDIPLWFQRGRFFVESEGMRAVVETDLGSGRGLGTMTLHAIDFNRPFVAATPSVTRPYMGHANATPLDVAKSWLRTAVRSGSCESLAPNLVAMPAKTRWPWLAKAMSQPAADTSGQYAFPSL